MLRKNYEGKVLNYLDELAEEHLWVRGKGNYSSHTAYVKDKILAQKNWADDITFQDRTKTIELINERSALMDQRWRCIIRAIKGTYGGAVGYAANFDNYHEVNFWDELDFVGINAYFPLRNINDTIAQPDSLIAVCSNSWLSVFDSINNFLIQKDIADLPVIFTELGYLSKSNTTLAPWKGFGFTIAEYQDEEQLIIWSEQAEDPFERIAAVKGLRLALNQSDFNLKGILYWKLTAREENLKYEPFGLLIRDPAIDLLQEELVRFVELE